MNILRRITFCICLLAGMISAIIFGAGLASAMPAPPDPTLPVSKPTAPAKLEVASSTATPTWVFAVIALAVAITAVVVVAVIHAHRMRRLHPERP